MLNRTKHHTILIKILKDIYADPRLGSQLIFKGGTAAALFYNLPRFSVDLDFDILKTETRKLELTHISTILKKYGELLEVYEKRFTYFALLRYSLEDRNVKIEISKRDTSAEYEVKSYLGIPILVMKPASMLAGKMGAFLTRKKFASRDVFDLWHFMGLDWEMDPVVLKEKTGFTPQEAYQTALEKLSQLKPTSLLHGLGELVDEKQKQWIRSKLVSELTFYLQLYLKQLT